MAKRKALLFTYSDNENFEIEIEDNTELGADDFNWETILLKPIEENGEQLNVDNGVSWGWA